ncbi:DEAD/DEAH box helicase [Sulfobacillus thermosulfidooxidans]|uniref:DEAD/DEAH box helicase n=1 Tax=Sulfobacillus thermosulfidooxidans TaxID=28034 RepID=UPI0006B3FCC5|nr:DEAD/DEAH box helicase family protein [Sulfobacillus thermosulfidooxidans]
MELRPYQQAALHAITAGMEQGVHRPVVSLPTGTGKTVVAAELLRRRGQTALFLAHRDELIRQAAHTIRMVWPDAGVGLVKGAEDQWQAPVVVASVQSLHLKRLQRWHPDRFGTIVVDECFPAGTLIDGKPIETLRIGDRVMAFNPNTGEFALKRVTHVFRRPVHRLVHLKTPTRSVFVTPNHPFWTQRGWVQAQELQQSDQVFVIGGNCHEIDAMPFMRNRSMGANSPTVVSKMHGQNSPEKAKHFSSLHLVWENNQVDGSRSYSPISINRTCVLFSDLQDIVDSSEFETDHDTNESQICRRENATEQPYEKAPSSRQAQPHLTFDELETPNSRRKWMPSPRATIVVGRRLKLADRIHCPDQNGENGGLSHALQNRYRQSFLQNRHRNRWRLSLQYQNPATRFQEKSMA